MTIEILGNEGAFSDSNTSYLINKNILLDLSDSIAKKLIKEKTAVNHILISHKHSDHIGGLETLLFYYMAMGNFEKELDLTLYVNKDCLDLIECLDSYRHFIRLNGSVVIINTTDFFYIGDLKVQPLFTTHCRGEIENLSFKFDDKVLVTCDVDSPLVDIEAELVFHDVGWTGLPILSSKVHPTEEEVWEAYGKDINRVCGIHSSAKLKLLRKAEVGEVFSL